MPMVGWPSGWIEWATAVQTLLTVLAFPLAWWGYRNARDQLEKTKKAAEAAEDAVAETREKLLRGRLMLNVSLVRQIESDLRESRQREDVYGAQRALRHWRTVGLSTSASIRETGVGHATELSLSIELARIAEEKLDGCVPSDVPKLTRKIATSMKVVIDQVAATAESIAVDNASEGAASALADAAEAPIVDPAKPRFNEGSSPIVPDERPRERKTS